MSAPETPAPDDAPDWQLDYDWLRVRHALRDQLGHAALPDLQAVLMLIGVQELGRWRSDFSKEEKQDLMHVGTCEVLSHEPHAYYAFSHRDADGWPHYRAVADVTAAGVAAQEALLKRAAVGYLDRWAADQPAPAGA